MAENKTPAMLTEEERRQAILLMVERLRGERNTTPFLNRVLETPYKLAAGLVGAHESGALAYRIEREKQLQRMSERLVDEAMKLVPPPAPPSAT